MPRRRRSNNNSTIQPRCSSPSSTISDGPLPAQRNAANARERARMRVLSKAFCRLKTTLPWVPADTKLSKLDTLRLATSYIAHLQATLSVDDESINISSNSEHHPLNLSWPFTFQHHLGGATICDENMLNDGNNRECHTPNSITTNDLNTITKDQQQSSDNFLRRGDCLTSNYINFQHNSIFNNTNNNNDWHPCQSH